MMEPSTTSPEDPFAEIRPYSNLEAPAVMERLTQAKDMQKDAELEATKSQSSAELIARTTQMATEQMILQKEQQLQILMAMVHQIVKK